jgi:hypothetical protein
VIDSFTKWRGAAGAGVQLGFDTGVRTIAIEPVEEKAAIL